ncbi:MAG: aldo/keto reductase [Nitrosopumilus sp. (ex Thoosa mismalolli)]|nr:aldo/keto reductase [Nitrosopumilus sp. (ex Thoosa mismalolli)]
MVSGFATPEGTKKFASKSDVNEANFRSFADLTLSNVGIGTYLGDPTNETDVLVTNAVKQSIESGINVVDTAINYRSQKAERSVGKALKGLIDEGKISRDEIFVSTKNGYVTDDADVQLEFWEYVKQEYAEKGVVKEGDVTSGYHCMTTPYLSDQLDRSLKNLDLETVDLMYLHNAVEGQIKDADKETFLKNLKSVFELYEQKRDEGKIKFYGMATWECFRVTKENPQYLSLEDTFEMARSVGGENHGFKFIQLPFNMYYDQALLGKTQTFGSHTVSALDAASRLNLGVFTSVPFMQGRLLQPGVMPEFVDMKPSMRAIQFIRSSPGVLAPLVGQKSSEHVAENMEIMKVPPIPEDEFLGIMKKLTS